MTLIRATVLAAAVVAAGCSPRPVTFDKLNIQEVEVGEVPASTVPDAPSQEGVVAYTRENAGIVKAVYRKTVPCPARMINSVSGIQVLPDRILLCFEPVESSDPRAQPFSACPYHLVIKYEMTGIPASVEPKFEAKDGCTTR
jgi:hypothetical protein